MKHKILLAVFILLLSFSLGFSSFNANIVTGTGGNFTETDTLQTVTDRGSVTTQNITASFFIGDGSLLTNVGLANTSHLVPYVNATQNVDLGSRSIFANNIAFYRGTPTAPLAGNVFIDGEDLVFNNGRLRVSRGSTSLFESTFSFWINLEDVNWGSRFDVIRGSASIGNGRFIIYRSSFTTLRFRLTDSVGDNDIDVPKSIMENGWNMVTFVIGEDDYRLYVNGDLQGQHTLVGMNLNANTFFDFMGLTLPTINGRLDGVQIYDIMLSSKQVRDLYNNGQGSYPIIKNNLVRHYSGKYFTGNFTNPNSLFEISTISGLSGATNLVPYVGADRNLDLGANRLFVNERVGIKNTAPAYDLDVTGDGRFTGTVRATDFITTSKVADFSSDERSIDKLNNVDQWVKDDNSLDYDKHYAFISETQTMRTGYSEVLVPYENCDEYKRCTIEYELIQEPIYEDVEIKGLSMETRVAEMEKMIWELHQETQRLQSEINTLKGVRT